MNYFKLLIPRSVFSVVRQSSQNKNPMNKTWRVLLDDLPPLLKDKSTRSYYPEHADVVIIGGGVIGTSVAYWLKTKTGRGLSVVVLEKDYNMYNKATHSWCFGGINQHFSLPENIMLSQFSTEFLRNVKENLGNNVDIQYSPHGNLVLANDKYAELLEQNVTIQRELGVKNELLSPERIKDRYPWINVDDIKLGCIASESEGWFNSWSLHKGLMLKSAELGAQYVNAEVTGFELIKQKDVLMEGVEPGTYRRIHRINYKTSEGEEYQIKFALCVLAGGADSTEIAKLAEIGIGQGLLTIPLPGETRKNRVFCIESSTQKQPGLNTPLIKDVNGMWIRRNGIGNSFICGHTPLISKDTEHDSLSDEQYFSTIIQPLLAHRIPSLREANVNECHTEVSDFNPYDETGIVGPHVYHNNLYIASGFGNQGIEHAPGIGRAVSELIIDSRYITIDLTRFGFDRLLTDDPVIEVNTY